MKKVCILQNGLARGGTDTFVVNLCAGIDKSRFEITVVNPSNRPESLVREADIFSTGAKIVHTHPLDSVGGKIHHLIMLYSVLKKGRFDVFQTNIDLFNGPNLFVAWLARIPVRCCHSHNTMQQKEVVRGRSFSLYIYQRIMRWLCWTFSNRRCGCSEEANDFLYKGHDWHQNGYPCVIYNGIDLSLFTKNTNVKAKEDELGLKKEFRVLCVGQIIPQKNPLFICDIFREICKERDDVELIWAGAGTLEKAVKDRLVSYGIIEKVHMLGRRSDIADIMHCSDIFLLPSVFEGLGIVLVEAQASGLQCLASDVVPKLADCGGITYMSLNDSAMAWARMAIQIIEHKVFNAIKYDILRRFSIENMVAQMERVFESIE